MKALTYQDTGKVEIKNVDDPKIENPTDVIIKVTSTAICGSDLHIFDGYLMGMKSGDILGHEFMGEVIETGSKISKLKIGDRIVVPFNIACGTCHFCKDSLTSLCDNTNPGEEKLTELHGYAGAGMYGYSHLYGGYAGGQAEYVRVINADYNHYKIPSDIPDEKVLFLTDIFPTGYMAAENAQIKPGDSVAVWGCGPVGQFVIRSAFLLGAKQVIAIDRFSSRTHMAKNAGAQIINYEDEEDVIEKIKELTHGRGPNSCIDAVGLEAHGDGLGYLYDKAKQSLMLQTDRPTVLRQVIQACSKGGTVSIPGVYLGVVDKFNIGSAFGKGLTFKMGQTHVHRYFDPLFELITAKKIDSDFLITHRMKLNEAPRAYEMFRDKTDDCVKVVLTP